MKILVCIFSRDWIADDVFGKNGVNEICNHELKIYELSTNVNMQKRTLNRTIVLHKTLNFVYVALAMQGHHED
jgi:hypothetical protein